jgi:hypothetical protein
MDAKIKEIKEQFLKGNIVNADIRFLLDALQEAQDKIDTLTYNHNAAEADFKESRKIILSLCESLEFIKKDLLLSYHGGLMHESAMQPIMINIKEALEGVE